MTPSLAAPRNLMLSILCRETEARHVPREGSTFGAASHPHAGNRVFTRPQSGPDLSSGHRDALKRAGPCASGTPDGSGQLGQSLVAIFACRRCSGVTAAGTSRAFPHNEWPPRPTTVREGLIVLELHPRRSRPMAGVRTEAWRPEARSRWPRSVRRAPQ
jgi:hypothetical protein